MFEKNGLLLAEPIFLVCKAIIKNTQSLMIKLNFRRPSNRSVLSFCTYFILCTLQSPSNNNPTLTNYNFQSILDTIEVSSSSKAQIDRLLDDNERLKRENGDLRDQIHSHQVRY